MSEGQQSCNVYSRRAVSPGDGDLLRCERICAAKVAAGPLAGTLRPGSLFCRLPRRSPPRKHPTHREQMAAFLCVYAPLGIDRDGRVGGAERTAEGEAVDESAALAERVQVSVFGIHI